MLIDNMKEQLQAIQATSVVRKLFELEHSAVLTTPTGEFSQLIAKVFRNLDTLLPSLYGQIIPVILETLVAVIFIGSAYGPIAVIQLLLFCLYTVASYKAAGKKAERNKSMMMAMFSNWGKIMSVATSYERAHFFSNVEHEIDKAHTAFVEMGQKITAVTTGEYRESMSLQFISLTTTALFCGVLISYVETTEPIELVALTIYFFLYISSLDAYAIGMSNLRSAVFEYQTFNDFVKKLSNVKDIDDPISLPATPNPTIEFKNVSFTYQDKVILDDVSFKVEGGKTIGIVGSSGCGKSTIIRLLLRFYKPTSGTISVNGNPIDTLTGESLRNLFSVVTQDAQLFNATIRDNIGYGKMGSSDEEILKAATLAELELGGDSDLTLDKECGEKGAKLSGGQQQRVALARAMLKNGSIYLLDEPTTGLDGVVAKNLQKTLDKLATNATTVCITHHLEDLKLADEIVYLDSGKVVERGAFEPLMAAKGLFFSQVEARK
jgi:ABC-type multidrug transport system fused ATPase/permease subunit